MVLLKSSLRHSEPRLMARVAVIVSRRTSRAVRPFLVDHTFDNDLVWDNC